jgi:WXG100 family type VII secretion target
MSDITVDYGVIQTAADDCKSAGSELQATFDTLQGQLKPLIDTWSGGAQENYHAMQKNWNDQHDEMNQILAQIAAVLPQIAEGYQSTESGVSNLF